MRWGWAGPTDEASQQQTRPSPTVRDCVAANGGLECVSNAVLSPAIVLRAGSGAFDAAVDDGSGAGSPPVCAGFVWHVTYLNGERVERCQHCPSGHFIAFKQTDRLGAPEEYGVPVASLPRGDVPALTIAELRGGPARTPADTSRLLSSALGVGRDAQVSDVFPPVVFGVMGNDAGAGAQRFNLVLGCNSYYHHGNAFLIHVSLVGLDERGAISRLNTTVSPQLTVVSRFRKSKKPPAQAAWLMTAQQRGSPSMDSGTHHFAPQANANAAGGRMSPARVNNVRGHAGRVSPRVVPSAQSPYPHASPEGSPILRNSSRGGSPIYVDDRRPVTPQMRASYLYPSPSGTVTSQGYSHSRSFPSSPLAQNQPLHHQNNYSLTPRMQSLAELSLESPQAMTRSMPTAAASPHPPVQAVMPGGSPSVIGIRRRASPPRERTTLSDIVAATAFGGVLGGGAGAREAGTGLLGSVTLGMPGAMLRRQWATTETADSPDTTTAPPPKRSPRPPAPSYQNVNGERRSVTGRQVWPSSGKEQELQPMFRRKPDRVDHNGAQVSFSVEMDVTVTPEPSAVILHVTNGDPPLGATRASQLPFRCGADRHRFEFAEVIEVHLRCHLQQAGAADEVVHEQIEFSAQRCGMCNSRLIHIEGAATFASPPTTTMCISTAPMELKDVLARRLQQPPQPHSSHNEPIPLTFNTFQAVDWSTVGPNAAAAAAAASRHHNLTPPPPQGIEGGEVVDIHQFLQATPTMDHVPDAATSQWTPESGLSDMLLGNPSAFLDYKLFEHTGTG